jgi:hypothetical protein
MGVRKEEEEPLDPHAVQQQRQQANSKLADAWKVVEDAANASATLAEQEVFALSARWGSLKKELERTQEIIKDASKVKWFAKKSHEQHQKHDPSKAFHCCLKKLLKHATAVDVTATVCDDKFAHAQLAAEKRAKEQAAAWENQVAKEQAASEEVDKAASDESELENDDSDKVHNQFCKADCHATMCKQMQHSPRQSSNVINGRRGKGFWQLTGFSVARRMHHMHSTASISNSCYLMERVSTQWSAFKQPPFSTCSR